MEAMSEEQGGELSRVQRVAEAAHRFAATAAEFLPEHPDAIGEDLQALVEAVDALSGSAADGDVVWVTSLVNRELVPKVELRWPAGLPGCQWLVAEARQHAQQVLEEAEAAEMDSMVVRFLTEEVGLPIASAAQIMDQFRRYRQPPPAGKE
jgi:hypothetical protein